MEKVTYGRLQYYVRPAEKSSRYIVDLVHEGAIGGRKEGTRRQEILKVIQAQMMTQPTIDYGYVGLVD